MMSKESGEGKVSHWDEQHRRKPCDRSGVWHILGLKVDQRLEEAEPC